MSSFEMTSSLSRYFDAVDIDERMEQMLSSRFATPFDRSTTLWNQSVIRRHPFHLVRDGEKVESFGVRNFETAVAESTGRRKTRGDLARLNTSFVKRGPEVDGELIVEKRRRASLFEDGGRKRGDAMPSRRSGRVRRRRSFL